MDALLRFLMGLPARPQDTNELLRAAPELLDDREASLEEQRRDAERGPRELAPFVLPLLGAELKKALRAWMKDTERQEAKVAAPDHVTAHGPLDASNYPPSHATGAQATKETFASLALEGEDNDERALRHLVVAGGPRRGSKEFLNLVTQVRAKHCSSTEIRTVILTDRYIHDSSGEEGVGDGFNMLIAYLEALGLHTESVFAIEFSPAMRSASPEKVEQFENRIRFNFPKAVVRRHTTRAMFHDRLFLVHDSRSQVHGVFGPSLNGLDSASLYIMGELDEAAIKRLRTALNL